jgi:hypothetical protein
MTNEKNNAPSNEEVDESKAAVTLPGTVEKIIKPPTPEMPEKAQISIQGAEDLYKEIRVDNVVTDDRGNELKLKQGAKVDVTIEADTKDTVPEGRTSRE